MALQAATHVLVVPNKQASIYTRMWCVYEAFLGVQWSKVILTARPSVFRRTSEAVTVLLCCSVVACVLAYAALDAVEYIPDLVYWLQYALICPVALVLCVQGGKSRWALHIFAVILAAPIQAFGVQHWPESGELDWRAVLEVGIGTLFVFYIISSHIDLVSSLAAEDEQTLLRTGFSEVEHAVCSKDSDKDNIMREIGPVLDEVNQAVDVLQETGMSTVALREAYALGVPLTGAREVVSRYYPVLLAWPLLLYYELVCPLFFESTTEIVPWMVAVVVLAACTILYFFLLWRPEEDDRAFVVAALTKLSMFLLIPTHGGAYLMCQFEVDPTNEISALFCASHLLMTLLSLLFLVRGRIAAIRAPCVGPYFAKLLGPGCYFCCGSCKDVARFVVLLLLLLVGQGGLYLLLKESFPEQKYYDWCNW